MLALPAKRRDVLLRRALTGLALLYPVALLTVLALFRFVGDAWWLTSAGLYLPRVVLLLPLPILTLGLVALGLRRLLVTQVVAAGIGLLPLMGLVLPWPTSMDRKAPSIRILSFNVDSGHAGYDAIARAVLALSPDIVLLQEVQLDSARLVALFETRYPDVQTSTQFVLASRFPVLSTTDPARIPYYGRLRSPRFLRHVVETPIGRVVVFNVHPVSPRSAFYALRGAGLRREFLSGRLMAAQNTDDLRENTGLRSLQVRAFAEAANAERDPVVIAGDTNLPGGSPTFARYLGRYRDGFVDASFGFGFTFPARHPWMRLDRILATPPLRIVRFSVGCPGLSDHLCVMADLQRAP